MPDLTHCAALEYNETYLTHPDTFYFSITQGYRTAHRKPKNREVFKLPHKLANKGIAFDPEIVSKLHLMEKKDFNQNYRNSWF